MVNMNNREYFFSFVNIDFIQPTETYEIEVKGYLSRKNVSFLLKLKKKLLLRTV